MALGLQSRLPLRCRINLPQQRNGFPTGMQVILAVNGVFHHFDLAHELNTEGYLKQIYSTFPWRRLRREHVPRQQVRTFPWIHTPHQVIGQRWHLPMALNRAVGYINQVAFDKWIARTLPPCDAYVALSGSGLRSGRRAQELGAKYVCDRGSSHARYQNHIVSDEYRRWGLDRTVSDPKVIAREEAEYEQADAISVPSEFARRSFIEMGVPAEKVVKIPYGVRLERFQRTGEPPRDRFEVLFTGSVSFRKGIPYLLDAFRRLKHPAKRLRIVGSLTEEVRPWLATQNLENVELLGRMPQPRLAEFMSQSHVMVLPSVEEGLALVQGQALACGCPLISSLHTGGEDLFTDGVEGFLVPIRSSAAIAERLQQLADDSGLQQRMSQSALDRVRFLGGWQQYGKLYADFLKQLIAAPSGHHQAHSVASRLA